MMSKPDKARTPMLTRRRLLFLGATGLVMVPGIRMALARAPTENRVVVVVLRGALDGLAAVPPYGDRDYAGQRGSLAFAPPGEAGGCLDLDGHFGLHPALGDLLPLWQSRELAVIHAAATSYRDRSHFEGQDLLETGGTAHALADGWLNRALAAMQGDGRALGLAVGPATPLILRGAARTGSYEPQQIIAPASPDFLNRLADLYRSDPLFHQALAEGLQAQTLTDEVMGNPGSKPLPGAQYLIAAAEGVGRLLADPRGPRVAVLEAPGWDTHVNQGLEKGLLAVALKGLGQSLVKLKQALGPAWQRTTTIAVTEFGRTVAVNGTGGTDHGTGTVALLLGGRVAGGRVIADWPGLAPKNLYQGRDLAPTFDLRAALKTLCRQQLEIDPTTVENRIFPDSRRAPALPSLLQA
jgi:uncharacterized protein (DUF1501 family)